MEDQERETKIILKFKEMLDEQTAVIVARQDKTDATLAPIAAIYEITQGFSSTVKYIFNSLVIPLSIIIGIIIALKKLIFGYSGPLK